MDKHHQIEEPSITKKNRKYRVLITDAETGEELSNEAFTSLAMLAEMADGHRMCETVLNINIVSIAAMMASSTKVKHAAKLMAFVDRMNFDENATDFENMLSGMLDGGIQ